MPSDLPVETPLGLPLVWVDTMSVASRADIPITTIRFYSLLVDRQVEVCRIQTSIAHMEKMAEIMKKHCENARKNTPT